MPRANQNKEVAARVNQEANEDPPIPEKLYFKIGEVAQLVGVQAHVLRYWEKEIGTIRPGKTASNQRRYRRKDVEIFRQVRALLYAERYTLAGAKKYLALRAKQEIGSSTGQTGAKAAPGVNGVQSFKQSGSKVVGSKDKVLSVPACDLKQDLESLGEGFKRYSGALISLKRGLAELIVLSSKESSR